jgi:hypothetical protein
MAHAPGAYGDAFSERIEEGAAIPPDDPVIASLWNCTDIMPSHVCEDLELPPGSTYARGVQVLKKTH